MINNKIQTFKMKMSTSLKLWSTFGLSVAAPYFLKNIIFKSDNKIGKRIHTLQYESIKKIVRNKYSSVINKYKDQHDIGEEEKVARNIWMIWWQGVDENTPKTIVDNINIIKQLHSDWNVNVVTNYNYKKYINVPEHMEKHIRNKDFSMTHISDYLRIVLLEKYGGIYLDCNFFVLKKLDYVTEYSFYTIKHGMVSDWHVSKGLWTTGFLAAGKKNVLFSFLKEIYESYFADYSFVPSYFFIDAVIGLGYENINKVKQEIDLVPYNNTNYNFINSKGNELFNDETWSNVIMDTCVLNANYKKCFQSKIDGKLTFFGYLYPMS